MRILLIHRYFWPDTPPYAHILRDIAVELGEAGHDVTVLTGQPSYRTETPRSPRNERVAPAVNVRRCAVFSDRRSTAIKAVNLAWFCLWVIIAGLRAERFDVVMAASTPPVAVAKTARWLARLRGAQFVYHKQDIYPEIVLAAGIMRAGPVSTLLRRIDSRTDRAAARVVVLSEDMAATVRARGVAERQIVVINNFDPWLARSGGPSPGPAHGVKRQDGPAGALPLNVVFAGNLGRFQNLEVLIDAATILIDDAAVEFHIFGDGTRWFALERTIDERRLDSVHLYGHQQPEQVATFLRERADLAVVSLAPGVIGAAYPSKTLSYLRNGCPVLALVEADSELARTVQASGAGFHADPTDPVGLAETLRKLAERRGQLADASVRARALYETHCDRDRQLALWVRLFESLDVGRAA